MTAASQRHADHANTFGTPTHINAATGLTAAAASSPAQLQPQVHSHLSAKAVPGGAMALTELPELRDRVRGYVNEVSCN
jgi:hypothetical protein